MLTAGKDVGSVFPIAFTAECSKHFGVQDIGKPDDRIEWGAKLMAHVCEESSLGTNTSFGFDLCAGQLVGQDHERALLALQCANETLRVQDDRQSHHDTGNGTNHKHPSGHLSVQEEPECGNEGFCHADSD